MLKNIEDYEEYKNVLDIYIKKYQLITYDHVFYVASANISNNIRNSNINFSLFLQESCCVDIDNSVLQLKFKMYKISDDSYGERLFYIF